MRLVGLADHSGALMSSRVNLRAALLVALFAIGVQDAQAGLEEGIAAYRHGDYQVALRELQPLAENGVPEAQLFLGIMYADGQGVAENPSEAVKWYRRAHLATTSLRICGALCPPLTCRLATHEIDGRVGASASCPP